MKNLEHQEQVALFRWASYDPICKKYLFAIPNGGLRNKAVAAKLKREGVKSGVSDIFLAYPFGQFHGLWIEMKRQDATNSSVTENQREWLDLMSRTGYDVHVAFGWTDAKDKIDDYLGRNYGGKKVFEESQKSQNWTYHYGKVRC